jgi:hypothetical protein
MEMQDILQMPIPKNVLIIQQRNFIVYNILMLVWKFEIKNIRTVLFHIFMYLCNDKSCF